MSSSSSTRARPRPIWRRSAGRWSTASPRSPTGSSRSPIAPGRGRVLRGGRRGVACPAGVGAGGGDGRQRRGRRVRRDPRLGRPVALRQHHQAGRAAGGPRRRRARVVGRPRHQQRRAAGGPPPDHPQPGRSIGPRDHRAARPRGPAGRARRRGGPPRRRHGLHDARRPGLRHLLGRRTSAHPTSCSSSGLLDEVAESIVRTRREARQRMGWMFDTYLLRRREA